MRLFNGKARYTDFDRPYELYVRRAERASGKVLSKGEFIDVVRRYCKSLSDKLECTGFVDLPFDIGSLSAVKITRTPKYNRTTKKYSSADNIDWSETKRTGVLTRKGDNITFGICFLPKRIKGMENFRSLGIVANRQLYRRMKKKFDDGNIQYYLPDIETYL